MHATAKHSRGPLSVSLNLDRDNICPGPEVEGLNSALITRERVTAAVLDATTCWFRVPLLRLSLPDTRRTPLARANELRALTRAAWIDRLSSGPVEGAHDSTTRAHASCPAWEASSDRRTRR